MYHFTVQQTARATRRVCAFTGQPLTAAWSVFRDRGEPISREAAHEHDVPLALLDLCDQLNNEPGPLKDDPEFGVMLVEGREMHKTCPYFPPDSFTPVQRRRGVEIGVGLGRGQEERLVSAAVAEERCPTLSAVMHRFHGTTPPPKPPTAEEIRRASEREEKAMKAREAAELAERMDRKKKAAAERIAAALNDKNLTSSQKAECAIEALYEVFQRRP